MRYSMHKMNFRNYFEMCPTGVRLWHVCSWCARWRILRCGGFAAISQLQNECTGLPNGTRVPKSGFAASKYPAKWSFGCKKKIFFFFGFRSCEMRFTVLRNGTRVPNLVSQRGAWGCELVLQQSADFAEATKSRRPLFLPCFCPVFAPFLLRKTSFQFLCNSSWFWSSKTYITSKQIRIKALKSKLKHWNQNENK